MGRPGKTEPLTMGLRSNIRRHPRVWTAAAVVAVALGVFVVVWFEPHKLFLDQKVDEALPSAAAVTTPVTTTAQEPAATTADPAPTTAPTATTATTAAQPTPPPASRPPRLEVLAQGEFRSLEHSSSGTAKLLRLPTGDRYLRFEDLDTSNGPDLVVYLSPKPASDEWGGWDEGAFLDLGSLKGNVGDQNYLLPADTDLSKYQSAVIWCRRFKVGFAVAPLGA
jgi:hypothetical protein